MLGGGGPGTNDDIDDALRGVGGLSQNDDVLTLCRCGVGDLKH